MKAGHGIIFSAYNPSVAVVFAAAMHFTHVCSIAFCWMTVSTFLAPLQEESGIILCQALHHTHPIAGVLVTVKRFEVFLTICP